MSKDFKKDEDKQKFKFLCFKCFEEKLSKIGKCLPQHTSTDIKDKCYSCGETTFVFPKTRFNLDIITETFQISRFDDLQPKIFRDGNEWCVLLGEDIIGGISGFGKTIKLAIQDWNLDLDKKIESNLCLIDGRSFL